MAETLSVLGQVVPTAQLLTDLYAVGGGKQATVSSLTVCNQSSYPGTFRVSVAVAGAADDPKQYIYYERPLEPNDTFIATIGMTLAATDKVRVFSSNSAMSFNLFGVEVS